jgi:hypothetical protein
MRPVDGHEIISLTSIKKVEHTVRRGRQSSARSRDVRVGNRSPIAAARHRPCPLNLIQHLLPPSFSLPYPRAGLSVLCSVPSNTGGGGSHSITSQHPLISGRRRHIEALRLITGRDDHLARGVPLGDFTYPLTTPFNSGLRFQLSAAFATEPG